MRIAKILLFFVILICALVPACTADISEVPDTMPSPIDPDRWNNLPLPVDQSYFVVEVQYDTPMVTSAGPVLETWSLFLKKADPPIREFRSRHSSTIQKRTAEDCNCYTTFPSNQFWFSAEWAIADLGVGERGHLTIRTWEGRVLGETPLWLFKMEYGVGDSDPRNLTSDDSSVVTNGPENIGEMWCISITARVCGRSRTQECDGHPELQIGNARARICDFMDPTSTW